MAYRSEDSSSLGFFEERDRMAQQLGWKHHALIQALMSRGPLDEKEFHEMFIGITGKNPGICFDFNCKIQILLELDVFSCFFLL